MIQDWDDITLHDLAGTLPQPDMTQDEETELAAWWQHQQEYPAFQD